LLRARLGAELDDDAVDGLASPQRLGAELDDDAVDGIPGAQRLGADPHDDAVDGLAGLERLDAELDDDAVDGIPGPERLDAELHVDPVDRLARLRNARTAQSCNRHTEPASSCHVGISLKVSAHRAPVLIHAGRADKFGSPPAAVGES